MLGETRSRILTSLCRVPSTAAELANGLGISANAVRVHLESLQRAELVAYGVERRGVGKPTHVYSLTPVGASLLSRAYAPALVAIVSALRQRGDGELIRLARDAGLALGVASDDGDDGREGIEAASALFERLGALPEIATEDGTSVIRTACCPLAATTRNTPEMCAMMETAVEVVSGKKARERCIRGDHPRCQFEFA